MIAISTSFKENSYNYSKWIVQEASHFQKKIIHRIDLLREKIGRLSHWVKPIGITAAALGIAAITGYYMLSSSSIVSSPQPPLKPPLRPKNTPYFNEICRKSEQKNIFAILREPAFVRTIQFFGVVNSYIVGNRLKNYLNTRIKNMNTSLNQAPSRQRTSREPHGRMGKQSAKNSIMKKVSSYLKKF